MSCFMSVSFFSPAWHVLYLEIVHSSIILELIYYCLSISIWLSTNLKADELYKVPDDTVCEICLYYKTDLHPVSCESIYVSKDNFNFFIPFFIYFSRSQYIPYIQVASLKNKQQQQQKNRFMLTCQGFAKRYVKSWDLYT